MVNSSIRLTSRGFGHSLGAKTVNSSSRLRSGKAPVRRSSRQAEKTRKGDGDLTVSAAEKTRKASELTVSTAEETRKGKSSEGDLTVSTAKKTRKGKSSEGDLMVSTAKKTRKGDSQAGKLGRRSSRLADKTEKGKLGRRSSRLKDPRLGAAERAREMLRELAKNWKSPGEADSDSYETDSDGEKIKAHMGITSAEAWLASFEPKLKDLEENEEEYLAERDYKLALEALKFYNNKHSTNYVVEETLGSYNGEFDEGLWTHCNFRAKNTAVGHRQVSRLFFAELLGDVDDYDVDSCVILDGPGRCCDIVRGCEMCPKLIRHPVNGFKNGHPCEFTFV